MVHVALGAARLLDEYDVSAEVVDPRTMWPLDEKTLVESVKKTSRAIVLDEGYERYGVTAELDALQEELNVVCQVSSSRKFSSMTAALKQAIAILRGCWAGAHEPAGKATEFQRSGSE